MADENITSADTQEGAQQQATDAQLLDDLTSLQQATEGMDEAQADGQVATNNEGDADNPSMTRPDDEFKDQRGLPEGGTTDTFALDNTDLQNSNEQSTTTDLQFTAQNTTQDATAINLDNVQIEIEGTEGEQSSSGSTRITTSSTTTTADAPAAQTPTTLSDPVSPTPTLAPPTLPTTPTPAPTTPTAETPPSGTEESDGGENSANNFLPSLTITKVADVSSVDAAGDVIEYTITVSNTGNQTLTGVVLTDEFAAATLFSGDTDTDGDLDVGETWTYTASHTVTQDEMDAGLTLKNIAKVDTDQTAEKQDDADTTIEQKPSLTITKVADVSSVDAAGDVIEYTITVSNAGNVSLTGVVLTDEFAVATYVGGDLDTDNELDVGETWTYTASHTVTQDEIDAGADLVNVASVDTNETDPDSDNATTTIEEKPSLTITKVADVSSVDAAGDVIEYTITVSNTGNQTLTGVVLTDEFAAATLFSGDTDTDGDLDVGETWTYTASHTVTQDEMDAGLTLKNIAKVDTDQTAEKQDDADTTIEQKPSLTITKVADVSSVDAAGDVIEYTITVSNAGNVSLTGVVLTDEFAVATYVGGDLDTDNELDVGETWTYTASHTVTQDEIDAGADLVNVASVDTNETDPDSDNATTTIEEKPSLTITKVADVSSVDAAGDVIEYTITVSNTGNQTLTGVVLTDEFAAATLFSGDTDTDGDLDVGETWTYTASHTVTQDEMDAGLTLKNIAKVDTDQTAEKQDDADTTIEQKPSLTITKVADVSSVDAAGDVIEYTITVSNAGNVSLTGVVLTDEFAVATYVGGDLDTDNELDVGETWTYTASHTVTQDEIDAGADLVNVASVDTNETDPDSDNATTTIEEKPSLTITKVADVSSVDAAGDVIEYTITVSNTGNQTLTGVVLTDEFAAATLFSGDTDTDGDLDVGETWTYTASHTVTQDEMDAGLTLKNIAKVDTDQTAEKQDDADTTIEQKPSLTITKVADVSSVDAAGDVIEYTITVSNAGNVSLTGVVLTDEFAVATYVGGDLDTDNELDVGETWTYTASHTVTQDEIDAGADLVNVASVDTNETDPDSDNATTTIEEKPSLTITKVADVSSVDAAGDVIEYTITVSNTGNQTLTGVVLTDEFAAATLFSGDTDTDGDLDVGETWTYTASHTVTQDEMDAGLTLKNIAKVDTDQTAEKQDDADTTIEQKPSLTITKVADVSSVDAAGDVIEYTITVSNAGNVSLTGVVLTDEFAVATYVGGDLDTDNELDVGETWTYTASHTVTQDEIDAGADLVNVASVDTNETDPDSDNATTTIEEKPSLTITKVADVSSVDAAGDVIEYTITVSNTGNQTLTGVVLTDEFAAATLFSGDTDTDGDLDVGETWTYTASHTVTQDEMDAGLTLKNIAKVDTDQTAEKQDDADTTIEQKPSLTITKVADVSSVDAAGDVIEYTITVSNAGNVSLTGVVLTDEFAVATYVGGDLDTDNELDVGETWTYTASHTVTQDEIDAGADLVNVASVDTNETDPDSDNATTTIYQDPHLEIQKVGNRATVSDVNDEIDYTLTVSNIGNTSLTNVKVFDAMLGFAKDEVAGGLIQIKVDGIDVDVKYDAITGASYVLIPKITVSDSVTITYTYVITAEDIADKGLQVGEFEFSPGLGNGYIDNEAYADSDQTQPTSKVEYAVEILSPEVSLTKTAAVQDLNDIPDGSTTSSNKGFVDSQGDLIKYSIEVANTGAVNLTGTKVYDAMFNQALNGVVKVDGTQVMISSDEKGYYITVGDLSFGSTSIITFTYEVTQNDINSKGLQAGESIEDFEIDNLAKVVSNQTSEISASYDVELKSYSDIAIYKDADLTAATAGSEVKYTLTVANEGTTDHSGIVLRDSMFSKVREDSSANLDGQQLRITIYDASGSLVSQFDSTLSQDSVGYFLSFGSEKLLVGQYAEVSYSYVVSVDDFSDPVNVTKSIFDYTVGKGAQGNPGDPVTFSYGSFSAYVNTDGSATYDVGGDPATVFVNVDNTGYAIGVNSGVVHGDKNAGQEHLKMEFRPSPVNNGQSLVEGVSIVFTNSTTVELGFKAGYTYFDNNNNAIEKSFTGSLLIGASGNQLTYTLREVVGEQTQIVKGQPLTVYDFLNGTSGGNGSYSFINELGKMYTLDVASGPGGAQNLLYTLTFNPEGSKFGNVNSFDFWVVGDLSSNSEEQIKVVDVQFDVLDFGGNSLENIASVSSDQDNSMSTDGITDEVDSVSIALLTDLTVEQAVIAQALGEKNITIKDTVDNIISKKSLINTDSLSTIKVVDATGQTDINGRDQLKNIDPKFDNANLYTTKVIISDDTSGTATGPVTYTFTFSEAVTGFDATDVTVTGGTKGTLTRVSDSVYTMVVTPDANSTSNITVNVAANAASDAAGNGNTAAAQSTQLVDTVKPTVTITDDTSGTATGPVTYTFTFSEAVTGFDATDVTVTGGTKGTLTRVSDSVYTMVVTPDANSTSNITVNVAANAASDAAGNGNTAAAQSTQLVDTVKPTVTITDDTSGTATGPVTYTFTFSEAVTGFDATDVTVTGGTKGTLTRVSDSVYTMVVTPDANSTSNITVNVAANAASDAAGNGNTAAAQSTQLVDTVKPTVTITDDTSGTATGPVTYTFTFSEAVTGFDATDVTVTGGTKGTLTRVSDSVYTMVVTPDANSTSNITVNVAANAASDAAGNGNTAAAQSTQLVDTVKPTVTITDDTSGTATGPVTYTFTFSEAVTGFGATDVTVTGGTKGTLTRVSDSVYTMVVTPDANSTSNITVNVAANAARDAAGNGNTAAAQSTQLVDTVKPTVTITDDTSGTATGPVTYTFTFSEAVTGFDATDVTVTGGTKGTLTRVSDSVYTMVVTPDANSTSNITVNVAANAASDAAGNGNTAAAQSTQLVDTVKPTVTITDDTSGTATGPVTYTFTFSEAVTGFDATDVTVTGGTKGTLTRVSDSVYTMVVTPDANSTSNITVNVAANAASDAAGNGNTAAAQSTQLVDTVKPTVTITDDTSGTATGPVTYTFTFSEAVTGFDATDVTVTGGTKGTLTRVSDSVYTMVVTPAADSTTDLKVNVLANVATDSAGNANIAAAENIQVVRTIPDVEAVESGNQILLTSSGNSTKIISINNASLTLSDADGSIVTRTISWEQGTTSGGTTTWNALDTDNNLTFDATGTWGNGVQIRIVIVTTDTFGGTTRFTSATFAPNAIATSGGTAVDLTRASLPITIDLNNDGIEYLSTSAGVTYDYNGDGDAESTAWVSPEDGLLALSQEDGSLKIVFSTQDGETDLQGLAKIYDSNQDGQLDELDTFFNQFGVWQDADSDGVVDSGEFQSLTDRDIVSLDLVSDGIERTEANGDVFVYGQTTYTKADGTTGLADDAAFVVKSSDQETSNTIQIGNSGEVVHVPDFGADDQIDLSTILANAAITRDNLKDYVQLVDGENGTVLNIDATGHGGEGGWVQVASLDNVHVSQTGVNMFFDPTNQTIDFTQSSPDEWKVEDGDTPV